MEAATAHATDSGLSRATMNVIKTMITVVVIFAALDAPVSVYVIMQYIMQLRLSTSSYFLSTAILLSNLKLSADPVIFLFHYDRVQKSIRGLAARMRGRGKVSSEMEKTKVTMHDSSAHG
jgi:hypothetical protein